MKGENSDMNRKSHYQSCLINVNTVNCQSCNIYTVNDSSVFFDISTPTITTLLTSINYREYNKEHCGGVVFNIELEY